ATSADVVPSPIRPRSSSARYPSRRGTARNEGSASSMAALFESFTNAQWAAFSFVMLGMALICGMLLRRAVPWLAAVYIPTSVLAGFVILAAGPLIPDQTIPVLSALPGLMINIVFAGIMVGKTLPSMRRIWTDAAPHAILGGVFSFGQFAIGGLAVTLLLTPAFGLPDAAGSIIEMSF